MIQKATIIRYRYIGIVLDTGPLLVGDRMSCTQKEASQNTVLLFIMFAGKSLHNAKDIFNNIECRSM